MDAILGIPALSMFLSVESICVFFCPITPFLIHSAETFIIHYSKLYLIPLTCNPILLAVLLLGSLVGINLMVYLGFLGIFKMKSFLNV